MHSYVIYYLYIYDFMIYNIHIHFNMQCSSADPTSLLLLADLAERSPVTLWSSSGSNGEALAGLFQGVLTSLQSNSSAANTNNGDRIEASLEAVVRVAIASDEAAAAAAPGTANSNSSSKTKTKVVPSSPASHLGKATLPALLGMVVTSSDSTADNSDNSDSQQRCLQTLAHAAANCPSLLAGDMQTLTCLLQTCVGIAQSRSRDVVPGDDSAAVALSALEVLASLVDVPDVR